jgi:hypothetical protein
MFNGNETKSEGEEIYFAVTLAKYISAFPFVNHACLVNLKSERNPNRIPCNSKANKLFTPSSFP